MNQILFLLNIYLQIRVLFLLSLKQRKKDDMFIQKKKIPLCYCFWMEVTIRNLNEEF